MTKPVPFCWYELLTRDASTTTDFYTHVVGWTAKSAQGAPKGIHYTLLEADDLPAAGLMALDDEACSAGAKPGWLGYVSVDDVDVFTDKAKSLGGTIYMAPADIPDIGRFAVIGDPHGAAVGLMKWAQPMETPSSMPMLTGRIGWHELMAGDLENDFAFYEKLLGWSKADDLDMGPMGIYRLFGDGGEHAVGGMMTKPAEIPAPYWGYYFAVDSIVDAVSRVTDKGGKIVNGPMEVPGGAWIVNGLDPEGVAFSLIGMR